jgi:hypothetical protein
MIFFIVLIEKRTLDIIFLYTEVQEKVHWSYKQKIEGLFVFLTLIHHVEKSLQFSLPPFFPLIKCV